MLPYFPVFCQVLFHSLVHDLFQGDLLFDGEVLHAGMDAPVDDENAMHRRLLFRDGAAGRCGCGVFPVGRQQPVQSGLHAVFQ